MEKIILARLKKIKGQVSGVEKMLAQNRGCHDVLQQLEAIRAAIKEVMILIIKTNICQTLSSQKKEELEKSLRLLFKIK